MFVWNILPFCGPPSSSLFPFDSGRLSYLTLGVESVTQVRPFRALKPLNHSVCFRDENEWVQRCAGAPGKKYFLFSSKLNKGDTKPRVVRSHHMGPENELNTVGGRVKRWRIFYLNAFIWISDSKTYLKLELFPWALQVRALPAINS